MSRDRGGIIEAVARKALSKPTLCIKSQRSVEMFAASPADQRVVVLAGWSNDEIDTPSSPATTTHVVRCTSRHSASIIVYCTGLTKRYHTA